MDTDSRRLELLKLEGLDFSQAEIVKELSVKCTCSERTVYSDFETRESWQPILQSVVKFEGVLLKVVNRYEQIYRQASIHGTEGEYIVREARTKKEEIALLQDGFEWAKVRGKTSLYRKLKM